MQTVNKEKESGEKFTVTSSNRKLFGERLKRAVKNTGLSQDAFADSIGVSRASLKNWIAGSFTPDADILRFIQEKSGCSLDWLITGKGDPSGAAVIAPLDMEALEAAIALTEEAAKSVGAKLTPDKKASISAIIYEDIADSPDNQTSNVDMANVLRLVRLAV